MSKTYSTRATAEPQNSRIYMEFLKGFPLRPTDFSSLAGRKLTGEQIKLAGYVTKFPNKSKEAVTAIANVANAFNLDGVPGFYVDDKTGHRTCQAVSGIFIPVRDVYGNISGLLVRNDNAKINEATGKAANKYVTFSSAGKTKGNKAWQTCHCPLIKSANSSDPGTSLRVTEGVLKADVATALGDKYCIGIQGLHFSDDFDIILAKLETSIVYIALDSGEDDSADIIRVRAELIRRVRKFGAEVQVETWDPKYGKGIDDVLASGNADKIQISTEEQIDKYLEQANLKDPNNGDWCYVIGQEKFYNIKGGLPLKKGQMCDKFQMEKVDNINKLIAQGFRQVDSLTYWPGKEQFVFEDKVECLNMWTGPNIMPCAGDIAKVTEHIEWMLEDELQRNILLDYLAFIVQNPGRKIRWAVIIQGQEGVGKSFLSEMMKALLGEKNISEPTMEMVHSQYTDWQANCLLIIIEEVMARGRLELMNKLKPMVVANKTMVTAKYVTAYVQPNRYNFLMFTNHPDPLILSKEDRRYGVLKTNVVAKEKKYYDELFEWLADIRNVQSLLDFFMKRDLSNFNISHAPMTEAKKELIAISRSPLEEFIDEGISDNVWPFNKDFVSVRHLKGCLKNGLEKWSDIKWANALKAAGAVKVPEQLILSDKSRCWVWCIRRQATYLNPDVPVDIEFIHKQYETASLDKEPGGNPLLDIKPM